MAKHQFQLRLRLEDRNGQLPPLRLRADVGDTRSASLTATWRTDDVSGRRITCGVPLRRRLRSGTIGAYTTLTFRCFARCLPSRRSTIWRRSSSSSSDTTCPSTAACAQPPPPATAACGRAFAR
eukprot:3078140-Pleurochrysis_carterae.AAC.1